MARRCRPASQRLLWVLSQLSSTQLLSFIGLINGTHPWGPQARISNLAPQPCCELLNCGRSKCSLRSARTADETYVCPHISPTSVPSAICYAHIIKVAVDNVERCRPVQIEYDIRV